MFQLADPDDTRGRYVSPFCIHCNWCRRTRFFDTQSCIKTPSVPTMDYIRVPGLLGCQLIMHLQGLENGRYTWQQALVGNENPRRYDPCGAMRAALVSVKASTSTSRECGVLVQIGGTRLCPHVHHGTTAYTWARRLRQCNRRFDED